jgi:hypothetical protein
MTGEEAWSRLRSGCAGSLAFLAGGLFALITMSVRDYFHLGILATGLVGGFTWVVLKIGGLKVLATAVQKKHFRWLLRKEYRS